MVRSCQFAREREEIRLIDIRFNSTDKIDVEVQLKCSTDNQTAIVNDVSIGSSSIKFHLSSFYRLDSHKGRITNFQFSNTYFEWIEVI